MTVPADPSWSRDYAASVRRLIRDGVGTPLAILSRLFAGPIPSELDEIDRE